MTVRRAAATGCFAVVALTGLAGPAAAVCDAYSGTCTEPPGVLSSPPPGQQSAPVRAAVVPSAQAPSTLPFTGGELVLLSTLGVGALAGGVVLVAVGRRRAAAPTA